MFNELCFFFFKLGRFLGIWLKICCKIYFYLTFPKCLKLNLCGHTTHSCKFEYISQTWLALWNSIQNNHPTCTAFVNKMMLALTMTGINREHYPQISKILWTYDTLVFCRFCIKTKFWAENHNIWRKLQYNASKWSK